jgi:hypothetical protein
MLQQLTTRLTLAVVLALAATSQASAQLSGSVTKGAQVPGMTVIPLGQRTPDALLLSRPAVQEELKLTPEQKTKLGRLEKARLDRAQQFRQMARNVNQNEFGPLPQADIQAFQEQEVELQNEVATTIGQILSPRQRTRLAQIALQVEGAMAFAREDILEKLMVDEQQIEAIRTILEGTREQFGQNASPTFGSPPDATRQGVVPQDGVDASPQPNPNASRKAAAVEPKANGQVLDEALRKIARVLRKNQWETYNRLKGTTFDLARLNGGPTAPANPAPANKVAAKPATTADADTSADSKPAEPKPAEPKASTRKSLRQRRGGTGDQP